MMNFQIQIVRHQEALPLTRDYMWEARSGSAPRMLAGRG